MDNEKTCKNCGKQINGDFKFCPYCGAKNEEEISSNILCSSCGKSIKSDFNVCPFCGEKLKNKNLNEDDKKEIFCKKCGNLIKKDFKICPYCRNKINNQNTNEIKSKEVIKSNIQFSEKNSMVCLLLMIVIGHIFVAHRFYVGRTKEATMFLIANLISIIAGFFTPLLIVSIVYDIVYLLVVWLQDLLKLIRGEFQDSEGKYLKRL